MGITSRNVRCLGIVLLVGGLWLGAGRSPAADMTVEEILPAAPTVSATAPAAEEGGKVFSGLPLFSSRDRFWVRADYLVWWTSGMNLPPLVTTSPQGTPQNQAGVLPGATILYGNQTVNGDARSGFRTTLGMWLDAGQTWDVEFDYLSLGDRTSGFNRTSSGDPILARPIYNVETGLQASVLTAYPGLVTGTISVQAKDHFQSVGALFGYKLLSNDPGEGANLGLLDPASYGNRTDLLLGFRYYNLGDRLSVVQDSRLLQASQDFPANTSLSIRDNFRANNDFYGGELGFRSHVYRGRWSLELLTKLAMGNTHQTATIDGQTVITAPNQSPQTYNAGLLALGTNSVPSPHQRDEFTVIPQLGLELGFQMTQRWRAYVGYDVLYWGTIWRAADQIDLNVDPRNTPPVQSGGTSFPAFPGKNTSFWAQGVNLGAEFRF